MTRLFERASERESVDVRKKEAGVACWMVLLLVTFDIPWGVF